jgi:hypothetical protein
MSEITTKVNSYNKGEISLQELIKFLSDFKYGTPQRMQSMPDDPFELEIYTEDFDYSESGTWEEVNALFNDGHLTSEEFNSISDAVYAAKTKKESLKTKVESKIKDVSNNNQETK